MQQCGGFRVLVTGASTGLGRAIAVQTAQEGAAHVIVNYANDKDSAEETARLVREAGSEATVVQGDVAQDADCRRLAAAASALGGLECLFNNAGVTIFAAHDNLDGVSSEDFMRLYQVNVVGAFQMIRACRKLLENAAEPGSVVNSASIAGVAGIGSSVPYAASKAALINMTLSLARALAPKIRVNAVCPGFIDTPWFSKSLPDAVIGHVRAQVIATTPLRVASTAEDIAGSAVFLGGRQSRHVTGETLLVDAGMHLTLTPVAR
jgi:3-oxoacyl-[acyl-carrier protein] reductase